MCSNTGMGGAATVSPPFGGFIAYMSENDGIHHFFLFSRVDFAQARALRELYYIMSQGFFEFQAVPCLTSLLSFEKKPSEN